MADRSERRWLRGAEVVGAIGVVASLVFVGLEIQQNTLAVRGATYQALSDAGSGFMFDLAHDPQLAALFDRVMRGAVSADFNGGENMQLWAYHAGFVRHLENTYLQRQAGVVDERVFDGYGWNDAVLGWAHFREWWFTYRGSHLVVGNDFVEFFDQRTGIQPLEGRRP